MSSWLNRRPIGTRLLLIALLFALPFTGLTTWLLARGFNANIDFAERELAGVACTRPLLTVQQNLLHLQASLSRLAPADPKDAIGISRDLAAYVTLAGTHTTVLGLGHEALKARGKEQLAAEALAKEWAGITTSPSADAVANFAAEIQDLIGVICETSKLILDPEFSSYSTMDIVTTALPSWRQHLTGAALQPTEKNLLLAQLDLDHVDGDMPVLVRVNEGINLDPPDQARIKAAYAAFAGVGKDALAAGQDAAKRAHAFERAAQADAEFSSATCETLAHLLGARVSLNASGRRNGLLILAGLLVLVFGATWRISAGMKRQLRSLVVEIADQAVQVREVSGSVADAGESLSTGACKQAEAVQQISAALEELSGVSKSNSDRASDSRHLTSQMKEHSAQGARRIADMGGALAAIKESSGNIDKIIKTIDEIAFQTNILALNAAVEAARAGEAGAGFAVVADEVRSLARRAAQAAKETDEKIKDSINSSEQVATLVSDIVASFKVLTETTELVDVRTAEIADASQEQAKGVSETAQAIQQIDRAVQGTTGMVDQTAEAARQLSEHASSLQSAAEALGRLVEVSGRRSRREQAAAASHRRVAPSSAPALA